MNNNDNCTFYNRVQNNLEKLSKKELETVKYMEANQGKIIYASITDLAEEIGVSEATVTRTCTRLGYTNFQELKVSIAKEQVNSQDKIHEELNRNSSAEMITKSVFASVIRTLNMTESSLNYESIEKAIQAICKSRRLVVIGSGNAGAIALDAQHKFMRIGLTAQGFTDGHLQMISMVSLNEKDVVLAISHSGSSRNISDAVKVAKDNGATIISITSIGSSPVSKQADINLFTSSEETKYRTYAIASRLAELAIIDTLYTGVALCRGNSAIENFEGIEKALTVKKY